MKPLARQSLGSSLVGRTLTVLSVAALAALGATPAASADEDEALERASAIAKSASVKIVTEYTGYIYYTNADGFVWSDDAYVIKSGCTGFAVSPDGHILTAGHCADPGEVTAKFFEGFLTDQVKEGLITVQTANELLADPTATKGWKVAGSPSSAAANVKVEVTQTVAATGISVGKPYQAVVLENQPLDRGDITLLKVEPNEPMPSLQISRAKPKNGDFVVAAGWPASVEGVVDPGSEPTVEDGRVTNDSQTSNGSPFIQTNAPVSQGMSGGPVVNRQDEAVGLNSYGPSKETQSFNFAAGLSTLQGVIDRHSISQELSPADKAFRDGLDAYFEGKYRSAAEHFTSTLDTIPSHAQAQKYKGLAIQNYPNEKTSFLWIAIWALVGLAIIGLLALLVIRVILPRRRQRNQATLAGQSAPATRKHCPDCGQMYSTAGKFCTATGRSHDGPQDYPTEQLGPIS